MNRGFPRPGWFSVACLLAVACAPSGNDNDPIALLQNEVDDAFERATEPREFHFPADHGAHPGFQIEWWYFTGNLSAEDRTFGYQLTLFRFGLAPGVEPETNWASRQLWLGQLALTDVDGERFLTAERISRQALGLAGARADRLAVHVEDFMIEADGPDLDPVRIRASDPGLGIDLRLVPLKSIVLQGDAGLSVKSGSPGNASYYYSLPRWKTTGSVRVGDSEFAVHGESWFDREWSTAALDPDQAGWDWFGLHLEDGTDFMFYALRRRDGTPGPYSAGTLVDSGGEVTRLGAGDVRLEPLQWWRSPQTGRSYPIAWQVQAPGLALEVRAKYAAQEHRRRFDYWEGAVYAAGVRAGRPVGGQGYLEMTGYE